MSAFDTFLNARDSTLRNGERSRAEFAQQNDRNLLRQASQAYASGDTDGTRNALAQAGDIGSIMSLDRNTAQADQQFTQQRLAAQERQKAVLVSGAQGLRRLPMELRWQAFQTRVLPILQEEGLDQATLAQINQDVMDDASLDSVIMMSGGEVEQPRYLQGSRGALDVIDPYSGKLTNIRQPESESAPSGFRWTADGTGVEPIPGYVEGRSSVSAATRAPARGRSSGGRSSGSPRPSSSSAPARKPWERY